MAGKPNNKPAGRGRVTSRRPRRNQSNNNNQQRKKSSGTARTRTNHYVFAQANDLRLKLGPQHAGEIRALILKLYDNGGGDLDFSNGYITYSCNLAAYGSLLKALERLTSS
uniref:Capsid protein n=1 Tax=Kibale red colobus virus 2 TaxID=1936072 RepID=F5BD35_9NIDO|nr:capsid protein [Kibale red colobus virus 2]